jgi:hypothetical protein
MTPEMQFECLLISRDPAMYCTIDKVLRNFSIRVNHCWDSSCALEKISKETPELVVIDWEGETSSDLLYTIWRLQRKKKPTIVAISEEDSSVPGAHLTLHKPVTLQSGTESLKAAYSRMLLDHRLNARFPVMTRAELRDESGRTFSATITDIGEGGVGLSSKESIEVGSVLSFTIQLTEIAMPLHIQARVIWNREYGTAGCEILTMPPRERDVLRVWLKAKARVKQPLIPV